MIRRSLRLLLLLAALVLPAHLAGGEESESDQLWLKGRLLVAATSLSDPNFRHTVVYMVEHRSEGAKGLIVNRRVAEGPLDRLLESLGHDAPVETKAEIGLYEGGPVARGRALLLHSDDYKGPATVPLGDGLALSDPDPALDDIARGRGPASSLLILGHAGWAPSQLEREIASGAWHVVVGDKRFVLDQDVATKWQRAYDRRGRDL
jgi:putative transcriptional regulator